jgi:MFS family permease
VTWLGAIWPRGLRRFSIVWSGQLVSVVGSGLTEFALGVWVYRNSGSATDYAIVAFFIVLPHIVLSPLAGALVDRWDRRWAMVVSDTGSALCTLVMATLLWSGQLQVWQVYLGVLFSSAFAAIQVPAYTALITEMVPRRHLGRANGMAELAWAAGQVIAPLAAGVLMAIISVYGVMLLDAVTFLIGVVTVVAVPVRVVPRLIEREDTSRASLRKELGYGWAFIAGRPGLMALVLFFFFVNFSMGVFNALFTPLVLSFTSTEVLGTLLSVGSVGLILGGVVMSVWGGPRQRIHGILGMAPVFGLGLILLGARPWPVLIAVVGFVFFATHPIINGSDHAIWQTKVPLGAQGRVFATRRAIENASALVAYLVAGPLADHVFEPLMAVGGPLESTVGEVLGTGPGRGIGLLFVLMGLVPIAIAAIGYAMPRLRRIEEELPDAVADSESEVVAMPAAA